MVLAHDPQQSMVITMNERATAYVSGWNKSPLLFTCNLRHIQMEIAYDAQRDLPDGLSLSALGNPRYYPLGMGELCRRDLD
jgi:hypothetical protein